MIKYCPFLLIAFTTALKAEDPAIQATTSYEFAFFKMIAMLVILLIVVCVSGWLLKRLAQGRLRQSNMNKSIKVVERRALSQKSMLYIIEYGGKQILIAESQLEIRKIDDLSKSPSLSPTTEV